MLVVEALAEHSPALLDAALIERYLGGVTRTVVLTVDEPACALDVSR